MKKIAAVFNATVILLIALSLWSCTNAGAPRSTAGHLMSYLKHETPEADKLFEDEYSTILLFKLEPPEIVNANYELSQSEGEKDTWIMTVKGLVTDPDGKLKFKEVLFKLKKDYDDNYRVVDSYGYTLLNENNYDFMYLGFNKTTHGFRDVWDLERAKTALDLFTSLKIDFTPQVNAHGDIEVQGTIVNHSPIPVKNLQCMVLCYSKDDNRTPVSYKKFSALDGHTLSPGESQGFKYNTGMAGTAGAVNVLPYLEWEKKDKNKYLGVEE